jgi:hypothetical protein
VAEAETAAAALPLWLASIPDPFTSAEGQAAAEAALSDADTVIANIKGKFQGTLPPGWPRTPALEKAIDDVEVTRDAMKAIASKDVALTWPKNSGKVGPTLVRVGAALYTQLANLEGKAATSESLPEFLHKLAPKLPDVPNPLAGLTTLLLLGGALFAYREFRSVRRLIEGT